MAAWQLEGRVGRTVIEDSSFSTGSYYPLRVVTPVVACRIGNNNKHSIMPSYFVPSSYLRYGY
jgi:hypothetical protein